jgi:hypothetical protein
LLRLIAFAFIVSFTVQAAQATEPAGGPPTLQESLAEHERLLVELDARIAEGNRLEAERAQAEKAAADVSKDNMPAEPRAFEAVRFFGRVRPTASVAQKEWQLLINKNRQMRLRLRLDRMRNRPGVAAALRRKEAARVASSGAQTAATADQPF